MSRDKTLAVLCLVLVLLLVGATLYDAIQDALQ